MSRRNHVPAYRLHRQSGQAIVTLPDGAGGRVDVLLGAYDTPASRGEYARVIAEWVANGWQLPRRDATRPDLSVNELILAYFRHVEEYHRNPDGTPATEVNNIRLALRRLRVLFGATAACAFNGPALEALRAQMVQEGLCRNRINKDVGRVKRMFRWGAARNLLPLATYQLLQTVEGLRRGRSAARETEPVLPVTEVVVRATLPFLRPQTAAMVELQWLTGMRSGEMVIMRTIDLDTSGKVWFYRPGSDRGAHGQHKGAWRGHGKVIAIGPKAQEVLRPWLRLNLQEYLFQPREAMAAFRAEQRQKRKSKVPPSQVNRRKRRLRKAPGSRYTNQSFAQAVAKAVLAANTARACQECKAKEPADRCESCKAAALPHWHPHQLRHTKATEIRREAGLDAARAVLGHRSPAITEVYAELDASKAAEVMERLG